MSKNAKKQQAKQRQAKKREEKRRKRQRALHQRTQAADPFQRHALRTASYKPKAWAGENPVDVAIFDQGQFQALPPDVQEQVRLVQVALSKVEAEQFDVAVEMLAGVPRSSPLSEWRLFIRGLIDWYGKRYDSAEESWQRLDASRRPARVAAVMTAAVQAASHPVTSEVDPTDPTDPTDPSNPTDPIDPIDRALRQAKLNSLSADQVADARVVRKICLDRLALLYLQTAQQAEIGRLRQGQGQFERDDFLLSPPYAEAIIQFRRLFEGTEPKLVRAAERRTLELAWDQPFYDIFAEFERSIPGPDIDPQNKWLRYYFDDVDADQLVPPFFQERLAKKDLTFGAESLPLPFRQALFSAMAMYVFQRMSQMAREEFNPFIYGGNEYSEAQVVFCQSAYKAYPGNRTAYAEHVRLLELERSRAEPNSVAHSRSTNECFLVMEAWAKALPNDSEPHVWLSDFYLDKEDLESARPHIQWLANSRLDNPKVRIRLWKFQAEVALDLCRRKKTLPQAIVALRELEPTWAQQMTPAWLAYMQVALQDRIDDQVRNDWTAVAQQHGVSSGSLHDKCLAFGAAQMVKSSPAALRPLRFATEAATTPRELKQVPIADLVAVGGFFEELSRVHFNFPGLQKIYRKVGKELLHRITSQWESCREVLDTPNLHKTLVLVADASDLGVSLKDLRLSTPFFKDASSRPMLAGYTLKLASGLYYLPSQLPRFEELMNCVKQGTAQHPDSYERAWLEGVLKSIQDMLVLHASINQLKQKMKQKLGAFGVGGFDLDDLDDDFDDYDDDDDDDDDSDDDYDA